MQVTLILAIVLGLVSSGTCGLENLQSELQSEIYGLRKTRIKTEKVKSIFTRDIPLKNDSPRGLLQLPDKQLCTICKIGVKIVLSITQKKTPLDLTKIRKILIALCKFQQPQHVCEGLVDLNLDTVLYILKNGKDVSAERICAIFTPHENCKHDKSDWLVDVGDKPKHENTLKTSRHAKDKADPITILQLTDIHLDRNYKEGSNAMCDEPMCCQGAQGKLPNENPEHTAGKWGHYNKCDIPWRVVIDALSHIKTKHKKIDYVYMTGDLVDHGIWKTSPGENNITFHKVLTTLKEYFGDTKVFPVIGNHDTHPVNLFVPTEINESNHSSSSLYETFANMWSMWLPSDTKDTILKGGYYTALVRPGFRVVVLNNMQCYKLNWWIYYNDTDPDRQLQWLVGVLRQAEVAGEKVHMLYHIPPGGDDCIARWSREYNKIINRFQNIVTAQFSGHTHYDEFHLFYSNEEPEKAINVLYTGGSLTPFSDTNGNYRIYSIDSNNFMVLDHETWFYNMTESNLSPAYNLTWHKMYSFKEAYKVHSLSPQHLNDLAYQMAANKDLLRKYFEFYKLKGDPSLKKGCDSKCYEKLLCDIASSDSSNMSACKRLQAVFNKKNKA